MKYSAITTVAIALVVFGIEGFVATSVQAGDQSKPWKDGEHRIDSPTGAPEEDSRPNSEEVAFDDGDLLENCTWSVNQDGIKVCSKNDENGSERVAGIEVPEREDGPGDDFGESGGGDFGEGDRAAASTVAE